MKQHKNISILGSTGSIGCSTLDVISRLGNLFTVSYLTTNKNIDLLEQQIRQFRPRGVAVLDEDASLKLKSRLSDSVEVLSGEDGLLEIASRTDTDVLVNAVVGSSGLRPTLCALDSGNNIAIANKETLVVAGEIVVRKAREAGAMLLPVDSEHSAILQCLRGEKISQVSRLIITASGGPFLNYEPERLSSVTPDEALNHPTWKMGNKITIDSATLMNKGLEVIEACRLFDLSPDQIEVVVHPQSIVHSMVEFADGSVKAQLGIPDMRMPIQYALMYPDRPATEFKKIDTKALSNLTFFEPDTTKFRCLPLAFKALEMGGTAPAVLNAANEVAVELFLDKKIQFTRIPELIESALEAHSPIADCTIDDILNEDREARVLTRKMADSNRDSVGHAAAYHESDGPTH